MTPPLNIPKDGVPVFPQTCDPTKVIHPSVYLTFRNASEAPPAQKCLCPPQVTERGQQPHFHPQGTIWCFNSKGQALEEPSTVPGYGRVGPVLMYS